MSDSTVVTCNTQLDITTIESLYEQLESALDSQQAVVIDGSKVERADSAGLQLLLCFRQALQAVDTDFTWQEPSKCIHESARLLGMSEQLGL